MALFTKEEALRYHSVWRTGKIEVVPVKPCRNHKDLSLAYSPGVAQACLEIAADPDNVWKYTNRGNLVAVVSNGTAVLGLGNIGPRAGKPVMEGKGVLFKIFADIDVFDINLDTKDPQKIIETVKLLEPTFGAINLEDIKAPECFKIEQTLIKEMDIPVFHDDQHGTAIISGAGLMSSTTPPVSARQPPARPVPAPRGITAKRRALASRSNRATCSAFFASSTAAGGISRPESSRPRASRLAGSVSRSGPNSAARRARVSGLGAPGYVMADSIVAG